MRIIHVLPILLWLSISPALAAEVTTPADSPAPTSAPTAASEPTPAPSEAAKAPEPAPSATPEAVVSAPTEGAEAILRPNGITVSANIPHPVFVDYERRFGPKFSAAIGLGGLSVPVPSTNINATVAIGAADVRARWHPFGGSFFLGTILGVQNISATGTDTISVPANPPVLPNGATVKATAKVSVSSPYITPHLGWLWIWNSGFSLGFELGYQFPFSPKSSVTTTADTPLGDAALALVEATPQYQKLDKDIHDAANTVGNLNIPYVTVLRLGWFF